MTSILSAEVLQKPEQLVQQRNNGPQRFAEQIGDLLHDTDLGILRFGMRFVVDHKIKRSDRTVCDPATQRVIRDRHGRTVHVKLRINHAIGQRPVDHPARAGRGIVIVYPDIVKRKALDLKLPDFAVTAAEHREDVEEIIRILHRVAAVAEHAVQVRNGHKVHRAVFGRRGRAVRGKQVDSRTVAREAVCRDMKTVEIPATGHDYGNWVTVNDLQHERICKNDHSHVEKQNHVWNGGVVSGNEIVYTCTVCGGQRTEPTGEDVVKVLVDSVSARPGASVDVYLRLEKKTSIKSMSISDIVFDEDKLELTGGEWLAEDSLLKDWKLANRSGVITFGSSVEMSGQFFKLTFKVKDEVDACETEISCKITAKTKPEGGSETNLAVSVVPGVITISSVSRGDVNGDNSVDSDDAIYLLYHTLLPDSYPINQNGDMNADGSVDSDDAIYLLYYTLLPDAYPLH